MAAAEDVLQGIGGLDDESIGRVPQVEFRSVVVGPEHHQAGGQHNGMDRYDRPWLDVAPFPHERRISLGAGRRRETEADRHGHDKRRRPRSPRIPPRRKPKTHRRHGGANTKLAGFHPNLPS